METGYWLVEGIRHGAIVRHATDAKDALRQAMADGVIQSWELGDDVVDGIPRGIHAEFIGAELPPVFEI